MEIRCKRCNRLMAKGEVEEIEIKCPRCGAYNHVRVKNPTLEGLRAPGKDGKHEQEASPPAARSSRSAER